MRIQLFALVVVLLSVVRAQLSDLPKANALLENENAALLEKSLGDQADRSKEGEECYEIEECEDGLYCTGRFSRLTKWTCAKQKKDGDDAETNMFNVALPESCVSGHEVCGICGKTVKEGKKCDYTTSCEDNYVCETEVPFTCAKTCVACPTNCKDGCHHDLKGTIGKKELKCGRKELSEKIFDRVTEIITPMNDLATCVSEVVGLRGMHEDVPKKNQVKVGSGQETCVSKSRDTGGTCRYWPCNEERGETYCDGSWGTGVCKCQPGYYAKGPDKNCHSCAADGLILGDNLGAHCSEDLDCTSGYCDGTNFLSEAANYNKGKCKEASVCQAQMFQAKKDCASWKKACKVEIDGECLKFSKQWKLVQTWGISVNKVQHEQFPELKEAQLLIKAEAYGSVSVKGNAAISMDFTGKKFEAALLKDSGIVAKAGVKFSMQVGLTYNMPATKQDLAPKSILFMGVFMAGSVPIFVNIWCKPIVIYSIKGIIEANAEFKIEYTNTVSLLEDMKILLNTETGIYDKKGFEKKNLDIQKDLASFWYQFVAPHIKCF